jgi:hypothetical protein
MLMMPIVRCTLFSWARRLVPATAILVGLVLLPTACSDDQPTEPGREPITRPSLAVTCTAPCFIDNFTDTDGTLLENHTPDGGSLSFGWFRTGSNQRVAEIQDNAVVPLNQEFPQSSANFIYLTDIANRDAAEVQVVLAAASSNSQTDVSISLRNQDGSGFNNYNVIWSIGGFNDDALGSILTIDGPNSNLAYIEDQSLVPIPAGTHKLRGEVLDSGVINAYIDDVLIATAVAPSPLAPGRVGMGLFATQRPFNVSITSFTAGDPVPPLTCTPSVERGQEVTCAVNLPTNWNVTRWEFTANDEQTTLATATESADDGIALSAGVASTSATPTVSWISDSTEWVGPVATGGVVTVYVTDAEGISQTYNANFTVTDRGSPWQSTWKYRRGTTPPQKLTVPDHEPVTGQDTYGQNCPEESCLLVRRLHPDPVDSAFRTFTPVHFTTGPNLGVWFVGAAHYDMERVANLNPSILPAGTRLHPVPLNRATNTCRQGLGAGPKAKTANANWWQFNNYCGGDPSISTGRNMTDFIDGIWAHEEFGRNGGSGHESLARAEAAKPENDPYLAIERLYAFDSLTLASLVDQKAIPISNRITSASADPKPTGNLPASGWLWFWTLNRRGQLEWLGFTMASGL